MCWADDSEGRFNALNDLESFPIARGRAALPPPSRGRTRPSCVMQAPESEPLLEHGVFSNQRPICSDGCSRAASPSRPMNAAVIGSSFDRWLASSGAVASRGDGVLRPRRRRQTALSDRRLPCSIDRSLAWGGAAAIRGDGSLRPPPSSACSIDRSQASGGAAASRRVVVLRPPPSSVSSLERPTPRSAARRIEPQADIGMGSRQVDSNSPAAYSISPDHASSHAPRVRSDE